MSNQQEQCGEQEFRSQGADLQHNVEVLGDTKIIRSIDDLIIFVDQALGFTSQEMDSFKEFAAIKSIAAKQAEAVLRKKDSSAITPEDVRACSFAKKSYLEALRYIGEERIYDESDRVEYYLRLHPDASGEEVLSIIAKETGSESIMAVADCSISIAEIQKSVDEYVETDPHMRTRLYPDVAEEFNLLTADQYYARFGDPVLRAFDELQSPATPEEIPMSAGKTYVAIDTDMHGIYLSDARREPIQSFDEYKESVEVSRKETLTQKMRRMGFAVLTHTGMVEKVPQPRK